MAGDLVSCYYRDGSVTQWLHDCRHRISMEDFIETSLMFCLNHPYLVLGTWQETILEWLSHCFLCRFEYKSRDKKHHRHIGKASNRSPWKKQLEKIVICPYIISCSSHSGLFSIQGFSAGFEVFRVWEPSTFKQKLICSLSIFQPKCWFEHSKKTCGWSFALRYWLKHCIYSYFEFVERICRYNKLNIPAM